MRNDGRLYLLAILVMLGIFKFVKTCRLITYRKFPSSELNISKRYFCQKYLDTSTNVVKDVILYKSDNGRFFKIINIFALSQFSFWAYLSIFALKDLRDVPVDPNEVKWWRKINLGEKKYKNTLMIISFMLGWGMLAITWLYTLRSIRYLILRKGGKDITIVTYTPIGINRMFTVGLHNVSCNESRIYAKSQIPLKVKGHYLYYVLDIKGLFKNPILFDSTAGLSRNLK